MPTFYREFPVKHVKVEVVGEMLGNPLPFRFFEPSKPTRASMLCQNMQGWNLCRAPSLVNILIPQTPANLCQFTSSISAPFRVSFLPDLVWTNTTFSSVIFKCPGLIDPRTLNHFLIGVNWCWWSLIYLSTHARILQEIAHYNPDTRSAKCHTHWPGISSYKIETRPSHLNTYANCVKLHILCLSLRHTKDIDWVQNFLL